MHARQCYSSFAWTFLLEVSCENNVAANLSLENHKINKVVWELGLACFQCNQHSELMDYGRGLREEGVPLPFGKVFHFKRYLYNKWCNIWHKFFLQKSEQYNLTDKWFFAELNQGDIGLFEINTCMGRNCSSYFFMWQFFAFIIGNICHWYKYTSLLSHWWS